MVQCDGHRSTMVMPLGLSIKDNDPDVAYLDRLWKLFNIPDAVWGEAPKFYEYDPNAEDAGKELAALAKRRNYGKDDPFDLFAGYLSSYQGPLGKPAHSWHVEIPPGMKFVQFVEPNTYPEMFHNRYDSFVDNFRLTVDGATGKVLKIDSQNTNLSSSAVWGAAMNWVFDPSTVPPDSVVPVAVTFKSGCERR
jgi:hypothetical protein